MRNTDDAKCSRLLEDFICSSTFTNLSLASDRKPRHPKKSPKNSFSCRPIRPVAGEGLNRPLRTRRHVQHRVSWW